MREIKRKNWQRNRLRQIQQLEKQLNEAEITIGELNTELEATQEKLERTENALDDAEREIERLKVEIYNLESKIVVLKEFIDDRSKIYNRHQNNIFLGLTLGAHVFPGVTNPFHLDDPSTFSYFGLTLHCGNNLFPNRKLFLPGIFISSLNSTSQNLGNKIYSVYEVIKVREQIAQAPPEEYLRTESNMRSGNIGLTVNVYRNFYLLAGIAYRSGQIWDVYRADYGNFLLPSNQEGEYFIGDQNSITDVNFLIGASVRIPLRDMKSTSRFGLLAEAWYNNLSKQGQMNVGFSVQLTDKFATSIEFDDDKIKDFEDQIYDPGINKQARRQANRLMMEGDAIDTRFDKLVAEYDEELAKYLKAKFPLYDEEPDPADPDRRNKRIRDHRKKARKLVLSHVKRRGLRKAQNSIRKDMKAYAKEKVEEINGLTKKDEKFMLRKITSRIDEKLYKKFRERKRYWKDKLAPPD